MNKALDTDGFNLKNLYPMEPSGQGAMQSPQSVQVSPGRLLLILSRSNAPYLQAGIQRAQLVQESTICIRNGDILPRMLAAKPRGQYPVQWTMVPDLEDAIKEIPKPTTPNPIAIHEECIADTPDTRSISAAMGTRKNMVIRAPFQNLDPTSGTDLRPAATPSHGPK